MVQDFQLEIPFEVHTYNLRCDGLCSARSSIIYEDQSIVHYGAFSGTVDFDVGSGEDNHTQTSIGAYFTKLNADGSYAKTVTMGGTSDTVLNAVRKTSSGDLLISIRFENNFYPNPEDQGGTPYSAEGGLWDTALIKLNSNLDFQWSQQFNSSGRFYTGEDSMTLKNGFIYFPVYGTGTLDMDPGLPDADLVTQGGWSAAVLKLNQSDGSYVDHAVLDGTGVEVAFQLLDLGSEGIAVIGDSNSGALDLDPGVGTQTFNSGDAGNYDVFLLLLNDDLQYIDHRELLGPADLRSKDLKRDSSGNFYLFVHGAAGTFDLDWGAGTENFVVSDTRTPFIVSVDSSFNFRWADGVDGGYMNTQQIEIAGNRLYASMNMVTPGTFNLSYGSSASYGQAAVNSIVVEYDLDTGYSGRYFAVDADGASGFKFIKYDASGNRLILGLAGRGNYDSDLRTGETRAESSQNATTDAYHYIINH